MTPRVAINVASTSRSTAAAAARKAHRISFDDDPEILEIPEVLVEHHCGERPQDECADPLVFCDVHRAFTNMKGIQRGDSDAARILDECDEADASLQEPAPKRKRNRNRGRRKKSGAPNGAPDEPDAPNGAEGTEEPVSANAEMSSY